MDADAGLTTPNLVEGETNRALVAAARQVAVVADSAKWRVVGLCSMASLDEVDVLITDSGLPDVGHQELSAHAGRLVVVPVPAA